MAGRQIWRCALGCSSLGKSWFSGMCVEHHLVVTARPAHLWVLEFLLFSVQLILFIISLIIYLLFFELLYITLVETLYTEHISFNIFLIFLSQLPKCGENCHLRGKDRRTVRAGGQPGLQSETLWILGNSSSIKC